MKTECIKCGHEIDALDCPETDCRETSGSVSICPNCGTHESMSIKG